MKKYELKDRIRKVSVGAWIFYGIMLTFIIVAIILLFVAMHLCGYNLATWLQQFGGWIVVLVVVVILLVGTYLFNKFRKGK